MGCYMFKDILFGLRREYLLLQQQLNSLKKYINMDENNLDDVDFYLTYDYSEDEVKMLCTLYDRMNKIEKIFERFKIELGIYPDYRVSYVSEEDERYSIDKYSEIIFDDKKDDFSQKVSCIFNTDFAKNARLIHSGIGYDGIPFLSVRPNSIYLFKNQCGSLEYVPSKGDFIHAYSYKGILTKDKVEEMLMMEFPRSRFSDYYQNLIENSSSFGKDFDILGDFGLSKKGDLDIMECSKKLILMKR